MRRHPYTTSDADRVAQFCIRGNPTDPREWLRRYDTVQRQARGLVFRHRVEILDVARRLYISGRVVLPAPNEKNEGPKK